MELLLVFTAKEYVWVTDWIQISDYFTSNHSHD